MAFGVGRTMTLKPDDISRDDISARKLESNLFCETFQMSDSQRRIFEP
jgi:hypothetical protein